MLLQPFAIAKPTVSQAGPVAPVQKSLQDLFKAFEVVESNFESMAKCILTDKQIDTYLANVFPAPKRRKDQKDHSYDAALEKVIQTRKAAARLFENGKGNDQTEIAGTLWAAYNGVIELIDHHEMHPNAWLRLDSLWFGDGAKIKEIAFQEACALCALLAA